MIMISSGAAQKVGKPPPPVPPRPSKTVVAEALAKSRFQNKTGAKSPARQAPPPPVPKPEITKSKSSYSVNVMLKKPAVFERSISEEVKNNSRTVVYQSSNVKCNNNINNNGNGVFITREEDEVKIVNNSGIFRNRDGVRVVGKNTCDGGEDGKSRVQVFRKDSVKRDKVCGDGVIGKLVVTEGGKRKFEISCIQLKESD